MSQYRRAKTPGCSYFFTVVTHRRQPLLSHPENRRILRKVVREVRREYPFTIDAWVLLPDHMHCIWTLPEGDSGYSKRWGLIKAGFSKQAREWFKREEWMSASKTKHRESTIWQRRFWEHQIRDQMDFTRHVAHPLESRQTRPCHPRSRLAIFHIPPVCPRRHISGELAGTAIAEPHDDDFGE